MLQITDNTVLLEEGMVVYQKQDTGRWIRLVVQKIQNYVTFKGSKNRTLILQSKDITERNLFLADKKRRAILPYEALQLLGWEMGVTYTLRHLDGRMYNPQVCMHDTDVWMYNACYDRMTYGGYHSARPMLEILLTSGLQRSRYEHEYELRIEAAQRDLACARKEEAELRERRETFEARLQQIEQERAAYEAAQ